ncbi:hypothetical protein BH11BAC3_BH11BAC3_23610 [soil metagenome]
MQSETDFDTLASRIETSCEKYNTQTQKDWVRYINNEMQPDEEQAYSLEEKRFYSNFTENECGQLKLEFLKYYLDANSELQNKHRGRLFGLFNSAQFAVLAVREKSVIILELSLHALSQAIESDEDIRDSITRLTLIYHSALALDAEEILVNFYSQCTHEPTQKLLKSFFLRKPENKSLQCMGYAIEDSDKFGFISADSTPYPDIAFSDDKKKWWKFW